MINVYAFLNIVLGAFSIILPPDIACTLIKAVSGQKTDKSSFSGTAVRHVTLVFSKPFILLNGAARIIY